MSFKEKLLHCTICKNPFIFSIEEQEFHASRGFINVPGRCPSCRQTKKSESTRDESASEDYGSRRKMFPVTCTRCGKATRLPFQPRQNAPAYCNDCYIQVRAG